MGPFEDALGLFVSDNVTREKTSAFMRRLAQYMGAPFFPSSVSASPALVALSAVVAWSAWAGVPSSAPAAGVSFLQGLGTWEDAGVDTNVVQWFENDTATSCDSFADGDAIAGSVSENALKGASGFDSATISSIGVIEVGTAGTTTVYACAIVQGGSANNYERALAAQWYPTGTVSLARAGSVPDFSPAEQGLGSD